MARPRKEGLEYFPLDVDIDQDDKVALIEAQHGAIGFALVIKLLMRIYKDGYFYEWTEKEQLLLSRSINVDIKSVNDIVNDCLKWEMFDKPMFENHRILTSRGIQKRFVEATSRRQKVEIQSQYNLLKNTDISTYKNVVIVDTGDKSEVVNATLTTTEQELTSSETPQSKVKNSKEKVKKKESNKTKVDYAEFVKMETAEYDKLVSQYGEDFTKDCIMVLDNYKGANNKKYASDYRAILNWVVKRVQEDRDKIKHFPRGGQSFAKNRTYGSNGGNSGLDQFVVN